MKKKYRDVPAFEGFKDLDPNQTEFEQILGGIYKDMISRNEDVEIKNLRDNNKYRSMMMMNPLSAPVQLARDGVNLWKIKNNFTSEKGRVGKWDHKPKIKEIASSYYRKDELNPNGRQPVVFGVKLPGDDEYIYDHDLFGNISYGYTMKAAGYNDFVTEKGAQLDDRLQSIGTDKGDNLDEPMVQLGMKLYDKYGENLTQEDLQREIWENRKDLRRYRAEDLETRSVKAKAGETLSDVAAQNGVSVKDLEKNLQRDAAINPVYAGINKDMSLRANTRVNLPQKADWVNAPITEREVDAKDVVSGQKISDQTGMMLESLADDSNPILNMLKQNDNRHEDVLYKPVSQITEDELREGTRYFNYEHNDPSKRQQIYDKGNEWYDYVYGSTPVQLDAAGRQIEAQIKNQPASETVDLQTKDNFPLSTAYQEVARQTAPLGVKSMQRGLNSLTSGNQLKEDGILGAKTTSKLKETLAAYGTEKVKQGINYGGFATMVSDNRHKPVEAETLKQRMSVIRPADGGSFLQKGLNEIGQNMPAYTALKEDNLIGEKTTSAFNRLKEDNEEELMAYAKRGFLGEEDEEDLKEKGWLR